MDPKIEEPPKDVAIEDNMDDEEEGEAEISEAELN
jgi:hypothetical protein